MFPRQKALPGFPGLRRKAQILHTAQESPVSLALCWSPAPYSPLRFLLSPSSGPSPWCRLLCPEYFQCLLGGISSSFQALNEAPTLSSEPSPLVGEFNVQLRRLLDTEDIKMNRLQPCSPRQGPTD